MKKCKRFLAVLLAMLMIGGAVSAVVSAAGGRANAFAFTMQGIDLQEEGAEVELTAEQKHAFLLNMQPMLVVSRHENRWMHLPSFLILKSGKTLEAAMEAYAAGIRALFEEKGWDIEAPLLDLYLEGVLGDYARAGADLYRDIVKEYFNPLVYWSYLFMEWFYLQILPVDISLLLLQLF